jgi:hypothetical protein
MSGRTATIERSDFSGGRSFVIGFQLFCGPCQTLIVFQSLDIRIFQISDDTLRFSLWC